MSRDAGGGPVKRPRTVERARVGWPRSLSKLKDLLYEAYLVAGAPSLVEIANDIANDDGLAGAPSKDTVHRCISDPVLPPSQADTVSIAVVLARRAAWDGQDLAGRVRDLWVTAWMTSGAGQPIDRFDDRLVLANLEVHRALDTDAARDRIGALPAYIPRNHDTQLEAVVAAAAAGQNGIAVLVGSSSTGKTRALWEAARKLPAPWRLWHPIGPTHPDAALAELPDIAPKTVVWLNEAQHYLRADPLGEQVAAGLRNLLHDPTRGPVLVLATLWPDHWQTLTTRSDPDKHAHARKLLDGHKIDVPDAFTRTDLIALASTADADPRLAEAAEHAHDAQITQYLAGVPVLMDRYRAAQGVTRALVHAAMDARRLGAGPHIPLAWLADSAPGYVTDIEWNAASDDWLSQALAYVTQECNGLPGILSPIKAGTPRNQRNLRPATTTSPTADQPAQGQQYQLADYLDQYGRHHRVDQIPPIDFWASAAIHARPADLYALGEAARSRGLYRDAAQLLKRATTHGNPHAAIALVGLLHALHPTDHCPARHASAHVALDNPYAVAGLLDTLRKTGADEQVAALATRAATHAALGNPNAVATLLNSLCAAGADEQTAILATRAATHVALDNPNAVGWLRDGLRRVRADEQAAALDARAAEQAALEDPGAVARLLDSLREEAGADEPTATLLARDPAAHVALDDSDAVADLLGSLRRSGADELVATLATRAATHAALDDPNAVVRLLDGLRRSGADEQVAALATRAATHAALDDPYAVAALLESLWKTGAVEQVAALATRAATHAALDDPRTVSWLLNSLWKIEADEQAATLATRAADHTSLNNPSTVAALLDSLRKAGADEQAATLNARAATHAALGDPNAVATLLDSLWKAGADEQAATLATRAATHTALNNPRAVATLLSSLRRAGASEQATALATRAATHAALDDPRAVGWLLDSLRRAGADKQAATLATRAAAHAAVDDPYAVGWLVDSLRRAGADKQAATLATRAADHAAVDDPDHPNTMATLLHCLRVAGADEQAATLATRAATHAALDDPRAVRWLLNSLWKIEADEQAATLATRAADHAAHAALDDPRAVAELLNSMWKTGTAGQAAALATWAATHINLDNPKAVASLLNSLHVAGAEEQIDTLGARLSAMGLFARFIELSDHRNRFRFGREPNGSAASLWTWEDLA
ncbi:hypothetical protein OG562_13135 [Streptomyces sp. NBC_01275]|uniref:hypothetical protein n=1 Tax=Streptomyces sp. NBC_01275 TaxID=2903807 RepID=UPI0022540B1E|nr:hypothetical protein [Streptomyces sp. NBC_01275]MCX4761901.1 hypothetical protein [Streptomyces sp. NBC_01275]